MIGAGLAGLTAAKVLQESGLEFQVFEASDAIGGRVRSDRVGGFILDRGFQVLLDSYPTLKRHVNLQAMDVQAFDSGALLADRGQLWKFRSPLRHPLSIWPTAWETPIPQTDKIRLARMAAMAITRSDDHLLSPCGTSHDVDTLRFLKSRGVSPTAIERFLRPFFAGVFLDNDLTASKNLFLYYLKKFALGRAVLPAEGVGAFPAQLASHLPPGTIHTNSGVREFQISNDRITGICLQNGGSHSVEAVILAVDSAAARRLLPQQAPEPSFASVWTVSFEARESLYKEKLIVLPAGSRRLIRHFVQITNVVPGYSGNGNPLIVATILNPGNLPAAALASAARKEISCIFPAAETMNLVDIHRVDRAVQKQPPSFFRRTPLVSPFPNLFLAGDHTATSSIEAAMRSGERAAKQVAAKFQSHPLDE